VERKRWLVPHGATIDLADIDPDSTEGAPGKKKDTHEASEELKRSLIELQERLWAENKRSVLLVLQALDAGGKDGAIRKVFSGVNPQGCRVTSFKRPSEEELEHHFLWRINRALPRRGEIGIFNRSHYEDVVTVRVHGKIDAQTVRQRIHTINSFERGLADDGVTIVKVFLHISKEEQAERLRARLEDPTKHWKFASADLEERARWDLYQAAFADAISATSTEAAPWYVVPADHKWYRDWALLSILVDTLRQMAPSFPDPEPGLDKITIN
jgi:PPK2 family polyphosphate:nucleotide phosphotransferase